MAVGLSNQICDDEKQPLAKMNRCINTHTQSRHIVKKTEQWGVNLECVWEMVKLISITFLSTMECLFHFFLTFPIAVVQESFLLSSLHDYLSNIL